MWRIIFLCVVILILVIVSITVIPYYHELTDKAHFINQTDLIISGQNKLGKIVVDTGNRVANDKTFEHKQIAAELESIEASTNRILIKLNMSPLNDTDDLNGFK